VAALPWTARDEFVRRFGDRVSYSRPLVLAVGTVG
jgi:hypothetical protein